MAETIMTIMVLLAIVAFSFYTGTLVGEDHQKKNDAEVFDKYEETMKQQEHDLKEQIHRVDWYEKENDRMAGIVKKTWTQNKALRNRCRALTGGVVCEFCPYDCEFRGSEKKNETE